VLFGNENNKTFHLFQYKVLLTIC